MPFESVFLSIWSMEDAQLWAGKGRIWGWGAHLRMLRKLPTLLTHFGSPFFLFAESKRSLVLYKAQYG